MRCWKKIFKEEEKIKPNKKYLVREYLKCPCIQSVRTHFLARRGCYWECMHIADPKTNRKSRGHVLANISRRDFTESLGPGCLCVSGIIFITQDFLHGPVKVNFRVSV